MTGDITPDSRLIEIAQVVGHPHQYPLAEDVAEGPADEPDAGAGITAHGHTGGLLFVQESELDDEIDAPAVADVPPVDETVSYEVETVLEHKPVEAAEPVSTFTLPVRELR